MQTVHIYGFIFRKISQSTLNRLSNSMAIATMEKD